MSQFTSLGAIRAPTPTPNTPASVTPALARYNVTDSADELERMALEQTPLLGSICLRNQTTAIYAKPNAGKTLITLHLLREAVAENRIDGADCYYIAADDNPAGVLEKIRLLKPSGVRVLAPGLKGFEAKRLPGLLETMITDGSARGPLVILDTLKKFANLMDKRESSQFADLARRFVMKGGSIVTLAHTNKRTDREGRPIFAGTSDIIDDFDCAYTMMELQQRSNAQERVVQFDCVKSRGNVAQQVAYGYNIEPGLAYADRLDSVRVTSEDELSAIQTAQFASKYEPVLDAIEDRIKAGTTGKMKIAEEVGRLTKTGRQTICDLIDKYEGNDPKRHRWTYEPGDRGVRSYRVLEDPQAAEIF